jgi:hypothetical protein
MAADAAARKVVDAFLAAAGRGDLAGLLAVLAPEVELRTQAPDGTVVVRGAGEVAARATMAAGPRGHAAASGARRRCPGRPHHGGRRAGHGHGVHGGGRRHCGDPRAHRPGPAGPGRPLVGRVTMGEMSAVTRRCAGVPMRSSRPRRPRILPRRRRTRLVARGRRGQIRPRWRATGALGAASGDRRPVPRGRPPE